MKTDVYIVSEEEAMIFYRPSRFERFLGMIGLADQDRTTFIPLRRIEILEPVKYSAPGAQVTWTNVPKKIWTYRYTGRPVDEHILLKLETLPVQGFVTQALLEAAMDNTDEDT